MDTIWSHFKSKKTKPSTLSQGICSRNGVERPLAHKGGIHIRTVCLWATTRPLAMAHSVRIQPAIQRSWAKRVSVQSFAIGLRLWPPPPFFAFRSYMDKKGNRANIRYSTLRSYYKSCSSDRVHTRDSKAEISSSSVSLFLYVLLFLLLLVYSMRGLEQANCFERIPRIGESIVIGIPSVSELDTVSYKDSCCANMKSEWRVPWSSQRMKSCQLIPARNVKDEGACMPYETIRCNTNNKVLYISQRSLLQLLDLNW